MFARLWPRMVQTGTTGAVRIRCCSPRGRVSSTLHRTALIYGKDGDAYVVVGSNGESARHPQWYAHLLAEPEVHVQVGADTFARSATGDDRQRLWQMMVSIFPQYAEMQTKT